MKNLWNKVNKCVVCGTKLKFVPSTHKDAMPQEGSKMCEQNHARFSVYGGYDVGGRWNLSFVLPRKEGR